jgi:Protein of unknown function (DUF3307)
MIMLIFFLLVVYQLKHFCADYLLQGEYMLGKFKPGWDFLGPLSAHVAVHGVMTYGIVALTLLYYGIPYPAAFGLLLGLLDAGIHFVMDRIKAAPQYMGRWKSVTAAEYAECKRLIAAGFWPKEVGNPKKKLRGNRLFWWALGFDQMVHHLTHYVLIYLILRITGVL